MKKILVISLLLAMVLTMILPSAAMAARPATFSAQGYLSGIDTGNVRQLGNSGKWLVRDRTIQGEFLAGGFGNAPFSLKYNGVFDLATQAGNLVGTLRTGSSILLVVGEVAPLTMVSVGPYSLPMLSISGNWAGLSGVKANGSFQAYMVFVPDGEGHVVQVVDSGFIMSGKYTGNR
jgi:hypothetical protein